MNQEHELRILEKSASQWINQKVNIPTRSKIELIYFMQFVVYSNAHNIQGLL